MLTFGAIDVGSLDLELTVYEISSKNGIHVLDRVRHPVAVGRDTYTEGIISYDLIDELCRILADFKRIMDGYKVTDYLAYATSAFREAKNNLIVLDQIQVRTGIKVTILSNSEERFLSYKAMACREEAFNRIIQKGTAIADIGSGSVQLSLFDKDTLVTTQYIRLGVLRLREILSGVRSGEEKAIRLMDELMDNDLETFSKLFLKDRQIKHIIALGTCSLYISKEGAEGGKVSLQQFRQFYQKVSSMTPEQITDRMGIPMEHAFLMLPSAMVLDKLLKLTGAEMLWLPEVKMSDGMAVEYAQKKKVWKPSHDFEEDILVAARNISKRYQGNRKHAQILEKNVLTIFDSMKKYHGLGKRERLLLRIAAILHDCGKYISMRTPAECAYNIIMSTEIIGISHKEREMVADIVKYNTLPYEYRTAEEDEQGRSVVLAKLVAILRIANAMDRSHKQKFSNVKIALKDRKLFLTTDSKEDITLEKVLFEKKADFFESVYGIRPVLKQRKGV